MSSEGKPQATVETNASKEEEIKYTSAENPAECGYKVWNPPNTPAAPIKDLPDSYFEPTLSELKASYDAQVRTREALVNGPLKTKEVRERELKAKLEKYPTTRIRVKFLDRTQLERAFPSTDKIRSVYAFVRSCLREDVKPIKFVLYQTPPRRELKVSDPKVRDLTLYELQLAPSSVLMVSFLDESLNDSNLRAPLLESILEQAQDLPPPPRFEDSISEKNEAGKSRPVGEKSKDASNNSKPLPKWLKLGRPSKLVTNFPDIGHLAKWSVSSHKFGFGTECLRDDDPDTFWHSDGPQPHFITVQFGKKVAIQKIALHLSFQSDDSYTPATLCVRAGTGLSDLQDVRLVTFQQPDGWLLFDVYMEPSEDGEGVKPLHAYVLQIVVVANHMNGKDTHVRGMKVFGPLDDGSLRAPQMNGDDPFPFKSHAFKMYELSGNYFNQVQQHRPFKVTLYLASQDPMAPVAVQPSDSSIPVSKESTKNAHQSIADAPPLSRVWRGDRAGNITLEGRPNFQGDKHAERQWIKEHMAAGFRYWGKLGYTEGLAGHITVRDPVLPGHYWMNPICVHFSSMKASDLVLVDPEGYVTEGGAQFPINAAGFHIHTAIHKARPDIMAAAHCHSIHARTWSTMGKPIDILTQDACIFHNNLSVYKNYGGIVLAGEEGRRIAETLGPKNKAVLLQNHGSLTLGHTVDEAIHLFTALENACRVQLMAEAASVNGLSKRIIDEEDAAYTAAVLQDPDIAYINFMAEYKLLVEETKGELLK